jgi:ubiquinone/menaquinone biosynthesis C-methylase UbiE
MAFDGDRMGYIEMGKNIDHDVVRGFGDEWTRFDQAGLPPAEAQHYFDLYFKVFPWEKLPPNAVGFDAGCGSGRWAELVAPRVGHLHCVDPSSALDIARKKLARFHNVDFHSASVDDMPFADESMDFGYSLGVLHHIPDTGAGMRDCVRKLKRGAPFLVYLYYALDNRPFFFRQIWKVASVGIPIISRLPLSARYVASQATVPDNDFETAGS